MDLLLGYSYSNDDIMNVKNWLIDWFVKNTNLEQDIIMQNLNENYLEKGWIDSLKFISLVTDIELKFSITFSNDMFQNKAFTTIDGLRHIIDSEVNGKI